MRVALLVHQYPPERGSGTEVYTHRLARALQSRGHEVNVLAAGHDFGVTRFGHADGDVEGVPVRRLYHDPALAPNPMLYEMYNPALRPYVAAALATWRPDVVHVTHAAYLSASALVAASASGAPLVLTLTDYWFLCPTIQLVRHDGSLCRGPDPGVCPRCVAGDRYGAYFGGLPLESASPFPADVAPEAWDGSLGALAEASPLHRRRAIQARPAFLRQMLGRADAALSPSEFLRDVFRGAGFPVDAIRVVPHGIDPAEVRDGTARDRPSVPLSVGYVGSLAPRKGVHVLVDAVAGMPPDVPLRLLVHGGDGTDPPYAADLRRRASGDPRIVFAGPFARADAPRVYAGLDVVAVPSLWYENAPLVIREAFVNGIPVVGSDLGGIAEALGAGGGILVPPGDAAAIREALLRLAREPGLRESLASRIPRVPTFGEEVDAVAAVYGEVLARR